MAGQNKTATSGKPKVSIIAISYNHEKYIRQAFESFVMQKTDFKFEVVVGDDCSTDGTQAIIDEYINRYPELFRQVRRTKNVGVQKNFIETMQAADGEYLAICECDDFWTDSQKLQRQAEFLDNNPSYALCFHPVKVFYEDKSKKDFIFPEPASTNEFTVRELLRHNFIQTNSVMYKKQDYGQMATDVLPMDWYLHLYHAQFGKIGFLKQQIMSAYRRHAGGLWWDSEHNLDDLLKKQGNAMVSLYLELWKIYGQDHEKEITILYRASDLIAKMHIIDTREGTNLVAQALKEYPDIVLPLVGYQAVELEEREKRIDNMDKSLKEKDAQLEQDESQIAEFAKELKDIKESKSWKLARRIAINAHRVRKVRRKLNRHSK